MQCEICGAEIPGRPKKVLIDGSELQVCEKCAKFGEVVDKFSPVPRKIVPNERAFRKPAPISRFRRRDEFREMPELVPDYGKVVREAREKMKLTPEKLGKKIKEKASLIKKIERHDIVPEDAVRKKLEKELDIKLIDQLGDEEWSSRGGGKGLTLGDIASIKKR